MAEFSIRQRVPFQCSLLSRPLSANNLPTTPSQLQSQAKEISALEITQVSLLVCIPSVHVHILRVVSRFLHAWFREHWNPHLSDMLKGSRKGIMIMRHYGILSAYVRCVAVHQLSNTQASWEPQNSLGAGIALLRPGREWWRKRSAAGPSGEAWRVHCTPAIQSDFHVSMFTKLWA